MSYSQPYTIQVPYSGSRSVSYPKSDSGGTLNVSYSGTAPAQIVIHVDTDPFDSSVSRVNGHIDMLTGAVIAMNAAQVAAINQTTGEVSASLLNGFFGTIKAELSQQLQALDSAIKAIFGLILEQGKGVSQKTLQMEGDFNRIRSRYVTLFRDLDTECYKRIYELDKPAFQLSENIQNKLIREAISGEGANNFIVLNEEASTKMMLLTSRLLRKVRDLIKTLGAYISQETRITALIDSFLVSEPVEKTAPLLLPVIFTESDTLEGDRGGISGKDYTCFLPDTLSSEERSKISRPIDEYCRNDTAAQWKEPEEQSMLLLDKEFKILVEAEFAERGDPSEDGASKRRVYDELMKLWQDRSFLIL
ncbi:MAG: hypothetical protein LBD93_10890 [Treponema sp.]|jgi:hypothetical protein|nr:hypothetical protein [Treponema sp.]